VDTCGDSIEPQLKTGGSAEHVGCHLWNRLQEGMFNSRRMASGAFLGRNPSGVEGESKIESSLASLVKVSPLELALTAGEKSCSSLLVGGYVSLAFRHAKVSKDVMV
jgi:hypothetical protein